MTGLSLLGLFAHPDDEQLMGGTYAASAAEGISTGLMCATRGEEGEIADPSLATAETLGRVREAELRAACAVLGIKYLWFLNFRDSGMQGTAANDNPDCFYRTPDDRSLEKIVRIVRDFKPTVMVTFEPTGGYGHPDHLAIHKLATRAFGAAADPSLFPEAGEPWRASRLYYVGFPRSMMRRFMDLVETHDLDTGLRSLDPDRFGLPDEDITNIVDVTGWVAVKERSLNHHRTQLNPNSPFRKMPAEAIQAFRSKEYFALAAGVPLPDRPEVSGDLFAGLRP